MRGNDDKTPTKELLMTLNAITYSVFSFKLG